MIPSAEHRLLVVSHPAVVALNQEIYARLRPLGWRVEVIVPDRWAHDYEPSTFAPAVHPDLTGFVHPLPITRPGSVQRHLYTLDPRPVLDRFSPDIAFLEEEYYSLPAAQWALAASARGVPFGVQADENLDRPLPWPARLIRRLVLDKATFLVARSPTAAQLARRHGGPAVSGIVPHAVPQWTQRPPRANQVFTVGYAGRLVEEKGVDDLLAALARLGEPCRFLVAGDGEARARVEAAALPSPGLELHTDLGHGGMAGAYVEMDVLVLPSRTTPRWAEQFGRVLVEALSFGVPVIGSDSGEIGWVITETEGGLVFPEGDIDALGDALADVRARPAHWRALGLRGQQVVASVFSTEAAAGMLDRLLRRALVV